MVMQDTNINVRISTKLRQRLTEIAQKNGLTSSVVIRELIKKYIREDGKTLETF